MKGNSGIPNYTENKQRCITNLSYLRSNMSGRGHNQGQNSSSNQKTDIVPSDFIKI